ncbi:hypothetical protein [Undibacterium sp. Di24W]|uniref:hypothetical protein n=1 Tax=Undibacterium sp. Di24W TaxID=3413033 RepID=UPI003BF18E3D
MKDSIEKLSQLAMQSANSAGRSLLNVQTMAQDLTQSVSKTVSKEAVNKASAATSFALAAGKSVQQSLTHVIEHETTQALMEQVKETSQQLTDNATHGAKFVGNQVIDGVKKLDSKLEENHLEIKEKTETVSMGLGIAAGVAAGAAIIGPPIVVAAAPVIGVAATVTGAVAGTAYFYSKWKTKKGISDEKNDTESELVDVKDVSQER